MIMSLLKNISEDSLLKLHSFLYINVPKWKKHYFEHQRVETSKLDTSDVNGTFMFKANNAADAISILVWIYEVLTGGFLISTQWTSSLTYENNEMTLTLKTNDIPTVEFYRLCMDDTPYNKIINDSIDAEEIKKDIDDFNKLTNDDVQRICSQSCGDLFLNYCIAALDIEHFNSDDYIKQEFYELDKKIDTQSIYDAKLWIMKCRELVMQERQRKKLVKQLIKRTDGPYILRERTLRVANRYNKFVEKDVLTLEIYINRIERLITKASNKRYSLM